MTNMQGSSACDTAHVQHMDNNFFELPQVDSDMLDCGQLDINGNLEVGASSGTALRPLRVPRGLTSRSSMQSIRSRPDIDMLPSDDILGPGDNSTPGSKFNRSKGKRQLSSGSQSKLKSVSLPGQGQSVGLVSHDANKEDSPTATSPPRKMPTMSREPNSEAGRFQRNSTLPATLPENIGTNEGHTAPSEQATTIPPQNSTTPDAPSQQVPLCNPDLPPSPRSDSLEFKTKKFRQVCASSVRPEITNIDNVKTLEVSIEELFPAFQDMTDRAIILSFPNRPPSYDLFSRWLEDTPLGLDFPIEDSCHLGNEFFMVLLQESTHLQYALEQKLFFMNKFVDIIRWSPTFAVHEYSNKFRPVWIELTSLHPGLRLSQTVATLAETFFGTLLHMPQTRSLAHFVSPRVLVRWDLTKEPMDFIEIAHQGCSLIQKVVLLNHPDACYRCKKRGHLARNCSAESHFPSFQRRASPPPAAPVVPAEPHVEVAPAPATSTMLPPRVEVPSSPRRKEVQQRSSQHRQSREVIPDVSPERHDVLSSNSQGLNALFQSNKSATATQESEASSISSRLEGTFIYRGLSSTPQSGASSLRNSRSTRTKVPQFSNSWKDYSAGEKGKFTPPHSSRSLQNASSSHQHERRNSTLSGRVLSGAATFQQGAGPTYAKFNPKTAARDSLSQDVNKGPPMTRYSSSEQVVHD